MINRDLIVKEIEKIAPLSLSLDYIKEGGYDNSGLLLDLDKEIKGILFTLDLTEKAVDTALENGCNMIVTHHPIIYSPLKSLGENTKSVVKAIQNNISVYSMHLSLDFSSEGVDFYLSKAIGDNKQEILCPMALESTGYGRIQTLSCTIESICERLKDNGAKRIDVYKNGKEKVCKVASFCGGGLDDKMVELSAREKVDCIVCSEPKHHLIVKCVEKGISLIVITHYASENIGFFKAYEKLKTILCQEVNCLYFDDKELY